MCELKSHASVLLLFQSLTLEPTSHNLQPKIPAHRLDFLCMQKPVWLDCDPGHDDALAIIHAGASGTNGMIFIASRNYFRWDVLTHLAVGYSPYIELLGISTIAANQSVEKVTKNALEVLSACGLDVGKNILVLLCVLPSEMK